MNHHLKELDYERKKCMSDKISFLIPICIGCFGLGAVVGFVYAIWWMS